jgi:hypothetical protein
MFCHTNGRKIPSPLSQDMSIMQSADDTPRRRSRVKKQSNTLVYIIVAFVVLFTIGFYFFIKNSTREAEVESGPPTQTKSKIYSADSSRLKQGTTKNDSTSEHTAGDLPLSPAISPNQGGKDQNTNISPVTGAPAVSGNGAFTMEEGQSLQQQGGDAQQNDSSQLVAQLNAFFLHLDQQDYMERFHLQDTSKKHFAKLMQKLIDNPPVIARETDDLFTLLKNTAHFFRILGKNNIFILKGILDREKNSLEDVLRTVYGLTFHSETLASEYGIHLQPYTLYDYGAFFLNTMGGRLYLFRRDAKIRLIVSFYSIMAINRAKNDGIDRAGIDLLPSIDSLLDEIENSGMRLKYKEQYLDSLYDLKEEYSR